jgi:hypothetical protein
MKRHIETKIDGEHLTTLKNLIDILDSGESADVSLKRAALIKINLLIQVDILIRLLAAAFCQFGTFLFSKFISDKNFMKNM